MKRRILAFLIVAAMMLPLSACSSGKSGDTTDPEENQPQETQIESGQTSAPEEEIVYNVDWDQCLADLKESVLDPEFFPYAHDVYVGVDEEKKQINFTAVLDDSTDPSVALEYADTLIRRYNLMANMQDSSIALSEKEYYGGLYDQYSILIGVAPQSKTDNSDEWFVFDAVVSGVYQTIDLQKAYQ